MFSNVPDFEDIPDLPEFRAPPAPPELRARFGVDESSPTRGELRAWRLRAALVSVSWLAVQLLAFGLRRDLARLPPSYLFGLTWAPLAAGLFCVVVALRGGKFGLGEKSLVVLVLAVFAPVAFVLAAVFMPVPYPEAPAANLKLGAQCFSSILAWTCLPIACAALALRRAFAGGAVWRSALLGGACGLIATSLFTLHCAAGDTWHVALAHGGAVLISAVIGGFGLVRATRL